jgi:hypothetical protein
MCDELLHRFILMGDGIGAEYLLADVRLACCLRSHSFCVSRPLVLCMRSKAWRAPGLFAHADVTKNIIFFLNGPKT